MKRIAVLFVVLWSLCSVAVRAADADKLFADLRKKVFTVNDYTAQVKIKINVTYMRIPLLAGTLYYKSPDKMRLERHGGLSILPKKNVNLTLSNLIPSGDVTVIDAGITTIDGKTLRVIKVVPETENGEIILTKIWVDEAALLAVKTQTTTRNDGTILMDLVYNKYASFGLPDKVTIHMDVKDYKLPKGVTMDYNDLAPPATAPGPKNQKGTIEIRYLTYEINKGIKDEVFSKQG
jgi:outer membrane lipoprotein-sorting protein